MARLLTPVRRGWRRTLRRYAVGVPLLVVGVWTLPHLWCMRGAGEWYDGDAGRQAAFAEGVSRWVEADLGRGSFTAGSGQFNGEWLFGTYMMAAMGFGQTALEHPDLKRRHLELMDRCIERILSDEVRAFDAEAWKTDPIESLDGKHHHAAFLGYFNLALSLRRLVDPETEHSALSDRITSALVRRVESSPTLLIQSYPGETYPVDNCAVIGSIGLYDRATGADHSELLRRWAARARLSYMGRRSGLLYQCVNTSSGLPVDEPRGSGTALGLYFLSFADREISEELWRAVQSELAGTLMGFGAVREYPGGVSGPGDIDSGPIIFGYGISATGFSMAGARIFGDRGLYSRIYASAVLWGAPLERDGRFSFVTGGPIGNAIMFAVMTAQRDLPTGRAGQAGGAG